MTLTQFITLHPDFNSDTLLKLIDLIGIRELLEIYKNIDQDHFTYVTNLYSSIWKEVFKDNLPTITDDINRFINEPILYIMILMRLSFYNTLGFSVDYDTSSDRDQLSNYLRNLNSNSFLLFNLTQLLLYWGNILYPGELFYNELTKSFIDYFMLNILEEKDQDFLLVLHELLSKYSL